MTGPRNEVPLRLLLASPTYHPFYSGAAERFRRYLPGLMQHGIEVAVLTGTPTTAKAAQAEAGSVWSEEAIGDALASHVVDGVPIQRVRLPEAGGFHRAASFARAVRTYCEDASTRPHVVQMFTPAVAAIPELWRLRRMGIPTVAARTMMPELPVSGAKRSVRRFLIRFPTRLVSCQVVGSHAMLEAFRGIGLRGRTEVIPHGVDIDRFRPARSGAERRSARIPLGIPECATVLLFVGSITPRKGVHRLVEAWCRLAPERPDLHLVVAGPRPGPSSGERYGYYRNLEHKAECCGAASRLHFTGRVTNVEELMRAADMFVLASSREGLPNVIGEAMASGVPVLTTPFSGLPPEFGEAGTHYVLTGFDPETIASNVAALLDAPGRRAELSRRGREWVEQHLTVERSIDRYAALYLELASEARERRAGDRADSDTGE